MACDDFLNDAERLLNGTLEAEAEQRLHRHLAECPDCAAAYQAMLDDDRLLQSFAAGHAEAVQRIEQGVITALESHDDVQPQVVPLWRNMMNNIVLRVAALFVVTFGAAILFNTFVPNPDIDFTAWDRVSAHVQNATAVYWHATIKDERGDQLEMRNWMAKDYGFRNDMWLRGKKVATTFYDLDKQELYALVYPQKAYYVLPLDMKQVYGATDGMDVQEFFAELFELEHTDLGTRRIDGRLTVGIEVTDATFQAGEFDSATGRLWVDVENEWPVRLEIEATAAAGKLRNNIVMDNFKWDEIDASAFDVKLPPDFKLAFKTDPIVNDQEHALEGLRSYAELTDTYPSVLNARTAMFEYRQGDRSTFGSPSDVKAMRIVSSCVFFRTISKDKEDVRYYGAKVKPSDAGQVLLRWRLEDNTYRVIFGDLSVRDVDAAELEMLEQ